MVLPDRVLLLMKTYSHGHGCPDRWCEGRFIELAIGDEPVHNLI